MVAQRTVTWVERPCEELNGWGAIEISTGDRQLQRTKYLVRQVPSAIGGTGFEVQKLNIALDELECYHVLLAGRNSTCECMGFLRHRHCRHIECLLELLTGEVPF